MVAIRVFFGVVLAASLLLSVHPASAEVYPLIIKGKVTMPDGSPPPFSVAIERICSDLQGSAPGPTTNKKGEYTMADGRGPLEYPCVLYSRDTRWVRVHQRRHLRS